MVQGDVTVHIMEPLAATIDAWATTTRVSANDKWDFVPLAGGQQIMGIHIEEV